MRVPKKKKMLRRFAVKCHECPETDMWIILHKKFSINLTDRYLVFQRHGRFECDPTTVIMLKAAVDTLTMNIFIRQNIGRGTTFKILKSRAVQSRFRQNLADVLENDQSALWSFYNV